MMLGACKVRMPSVRRKYPASLLVNQVYANENINIQVNIGAHIIEKVDSHHEAAGCGCGGSASLWLDEISIQSVLLICAQKLTFE
jgi:hypothetical protein